MRDDQLEGKAYQQEKHAELEAAVKSANVQDGYALAGSIHDGFRRQYPDNAKPPVGFTQDGSRPVGERLNSTDEHGRTTSHEINDVNLVQTKDGMVWGYVYHTTDGRLFMQQDQNSRGSYSVSGSVGSVSVGYTPPPATRAELVTDVSQLPPESTVQPSTATVDGRRVSQQLIPAEPRGHLDAVVQANRDVGLGDRGAVTAASGRGDVASALGNPAVGSYVAVTPNGAQELTLARSGPQLGG